MFKHPRGQRILPEGKFLGEMTREYADKDILEFVAGGPKYYYSFNSRIFIILDNMQSNYAIKKQRQSAM
jgi:hypothetical protein